MAKLGMAISRRSLISAGIACCFPRLLPAAKPGGRAQYVGGTVPELAVKSDTTLVITDPDALLVHAKKQTLRIPFVKINVLEYGQRVNRRYVEAIVISPLMLLSKSRKHFLTIGYEDGKGVQQSMVFRMEKDDVRPVLAALEARTGRKIEYQDAEARRSGKG
jgi:hypothetical protein